MRSKLLAGAPKLVLGTIVPMAVLASGCTDSTAPSKIPQASAATSTAGIAFQPAAARGIDGEFSRLAAQIGGFGGMYFDASGKLNVYVKSQPGASATRSADVVAALRTLGGRAVQDRLRRTADVVMQEGRYDYVELQRWKGQLNTVFGARGVVFTDIDEAQNRLRIGITDDASEQEVVRALSGAGIPRDAVIIGRTSPMRNMVQTLQGKFRPVPGGVQIFFPAPSEGPNIAYVCTLGFNSQSPNYPGQNFFVTASHCSDIQGGTEETPYFQPLPGQNGQNANRIGVEFNDPPYGDPLGLCYEGFQCRLSDALLARYRNNVQPQLGKIARTTAGLGRIGSIVINPRNPRWTIIGEFPFPFLGETAHKVGRTTGWTQGDVILTCVDVAVGYIIQHCQDFALAGVGGGDSGAPVFERADDFTGGETSDVFLIGLLWGGGTIDGAPIFIFSSMENIEFELGPLTTSANESLVAAAP
ncbi:MAG: hypothetical protein H7Z74_09570 [Anaerolineae bacterium]|nr:hypothetical protein [Gemmatimonadaceae bacterium]